MMNPFKLVKKLSFDEELVAKIKQSEIDKNMLYNHLVSGRISMQEYLTAVGISH